MHGKGGGKFDFWINFTIHFTFMKVLKLGKLRELCDK